MDLLDLLAGDKRFKELKGEVENIRNEGRTVNMCELLDEIENRGIEKGIEKGLEKGRREGRQEGRQEGETLATLNIARNLKNNGTETNLIIKVTGLSREQIEKL